MADFRQESGLTGPNMALHATAKSAPRMSAMRYAS